MELIQDLCALENIISANISGVKIKRTSFEQTTNIYFFNTILTSGYGVKKIFSVQLTILKNLFKFSLVHII